MKVLHITVQHKTLAGENFGGFGGQLAIRQSFIRQSFICQILQILIVNYY